MGARHRGRLAIALYLPLIWTLKHQGLHDMAAGTIVMDDEAVPSA
ncbi:MAG: hypothetical protein ACLGI2_02075 [Acidimicrobiia bacterium]